MNSKNMEIYKPCEHIERTRPNQDVDQKLIERIASDFRTLPSFEKTVFEDKFVKHYSLERNEYLACRWVQFRNNLIKRVKEPFEFPTNGDLHFYNHTVRHMPLMTIPRMVDIRRKLKPGPGVDNRGQMPIPFELYMKRGEAKKEDKGKRLSKNDGKNQAKHGKKDKAKNAKPEETKGPKDVEEKSLEKAET